MVKLNLNTQEQANLQDIFKKPRKYTKIKKQDLPKQQSNHLHDKPYKKSKNKVTTSISFLSNISQQLDQIDFALYNSMMEKKKLVSICLIDKNGKFIFFNSLARQHFQGSLNDLEKYSFFDLIAMISKQQIIQTLRNPFEQKIIKYCIYSKNTKRKYSKMYVSNAHCEELYLKYLKTLCSRIRPIKFRLSKDNILKQHWNKQFIKNYEEIYELYLLQTRHSKKIQQYDESKIINDPIIMKFQKNSQKKMSYDINSRSKINQKLNDFHSDNENQEVSHEKDQSDKSDQNYENDENYEDKNDENDMNDQNDDNEMYQEQRQFEDHPEDKYLL